MSEALDGRQMRRGKMGHSRVPDVLGQHVAMTSPGRRRVVLTGNDQDWGLNRGQERRLIHVP